MKEELFQQLASSLKEGGAILRGKKKIASTLLRVAESHPEAVLEALHQRFGSAVMFRFDHGMSVILD